MDWLPLVVAALLLLGGGFGVFYAIVKWIVSDAPPGTRFLGITNFKRPEDP